jgi:hypothetical protein
VLRLLRRTGVNSTRSETPPRPCWDCFLVRGSRSSFWWGSFSIGMILRRGSPNSRTVQSDGSSAHPPRRCRVAAPFAPSQEADRAATQGRRSVVNDLAFQDRWASVRRSASPALVHGNVQPVDSHFDPTNCDMVPYATLAIPLIQKISIAPIRCSITNDGLQGRPLPSASTLAIGGSIIVWTNAESRAMACDFCSK